MPQTAPACATFRVTPVLPAKGPLPEVPYRDAVEALLAPTPTETERELIENFRSRGVTFPQPARPASRPVEACTRYHGRLVADVVYHPFLAAVDKAFARHHPLCLSPDAVWLVICQGVANHVNAFAERLRHRFVSHEGRRTIEVRRDDFVKGSPENPWAEVIEEITGHVRRQVGPAADLFIPDFSTTGPVERVAAGVTLLEGVQAYYQFVVRVRCGIPSITLEGTTDDWEALADRAKAFAAFGMERWVEILRRILHQFARAAAGDVDTHFWRSIYRLNHECGGSIITGWVRAFFPYLKDLKTGRADVQVREFFDDPWRQSLSTSPDDDGESLEEAELEREESLLQLFDPRRALQFRHAEGPTTESLPSGLSRAPFVLNYLGRPYPMEFLGGFVGVAQNPVTLALRPEIGWAVRESAGPS
ncbi:MAG: DUF4419 domain-containing protein [Isosphaeraceae bacterium]